MIDLPILIIGLAIGYLLGRSHEAKPPITNVYLDLHPMEQVEPDESERWWESN